MAHDYADALALIHDGASALEARQPMAAPDLCGLWLDTDAAAAALAIVLRGLEADATDALVGMIGEGPDDTLDTPSGAVLLGVRRGYDRWRGRALLDELCGAFVVPDTGEVVPAVSLEVLRDVIPGVADYDATSSRWLRRGVARRVHLSRFLEAGESIPVIRKVRP